MPSQLHEMLVSLFRSNPGLAAKLIRDALHVPVPWFTAARVESADLTDVQPAEYRADLVVCLAAEGPALGIVVEVQLRRDDRKRFAWPAYAHSLRARLRCPVCLLVVAGDERVAEWAAEPIDTGGGNVFRPLVLAPSRVPAVLDAAQARADPELAVLSAIAHGRADPPRRAVAIAVVAQRASLDLDDDRSRMYFDLIQASLGEAARRELQNMDPAKYEYQSEFARRFVAEGTAVGRAEGKAEGKVELLLRQLSMRFGPLAEATRVRVANAPLDELDAIGERLLVAGTLDDVLGGR